MTPSVVTPSVVTPSAASVVTPSAASVVTPSLVGVSLFAAGFLFAAGCGGAPPPARPSANEPELGALITLVPAGSTFVLIARPQQILEEESSRRVITAMFPTEQLDRFSQRSGVDPRQLTELVIADHPEGRIVLARGPFDASFAVREAGERMAPLESSVDRPWTRRAGFLGSRRVDLAALAHDAVVWIEGTPQLAGEVLAAARRPPDERRHALGDRVVREQRAAYDGASLVVVAPHPLGLPLDTGVGMLLARQRSLAAAVYPEERAIRVMADLRGEFPPGAEDNFRALARSLAESPLGAALGLSEALPSLRIETDAARVAIRLELDPGLLARGLRVLLVAELPELVEPPGLSSPEEPPSEGPPSEEPPL